MSNSDLLMMYTAGTISFPAKGQGYGVVSIATKGKKSTSTTVVKIEQQLSHETTIARSFFACDVKAVYIPNSSNESCELEDGEWHVGPGKVKYLLGKKQDSGESFRAIIFVSEDAQSLLETKVGLTAAESCEYYPPVPQKKTSGGSQYTPSKTGCIVVDPYAPPPPPPPPPPGP